MRWEDVLQHPAAAAAAHQQQQVVIDSGLMPGDAPAAWGSAAWRMEDSSQAWWGRTLALQQLDGQLVCRMPAADLVTKAYCGHPFFCCIT
jgi:hypothetical protein